MLPAAVRAASATDAERAQITTESLRALAEAADLPAPSVRLWIGRGSAEGLTHEINRWLRSQGLDARACRMASAAAGDVRAVVLAPRSAAFTATVRRADASAEVRVSFSARFDVEVRNAHVVLSSPDGRSFVADLARDYLLPGSGTWLAQLVADSEQGPIGWARRTIVVGAATERPRPSDEREAPAVRDARTWLVALNHQRRAAGTAAVRADALLQSIAESRAQMRARLSAVAHSLSDDAPDAHLRREHIRTERVAENVVRAPSLAEAFARLDASPSHHRVRMDRAVDAVAIAAVHAADGWYVVELFALRPALLQ